MQLSLKATRPIALLMVGRISGFSLSTKTNQRYNLRVTVTMSGSYDLRKLQKSIKNVTAAMVRSIQCSILSLTAANSGWPGQLVILHRIFSNIKGETQTPEHRESTEQLFSVSYFLV